MYGYLIGATLMIAAGIVEIVLGVDAAGRQLEDIAKPLTAEDAEAREEGGGELDVDKLKGEDAAPIEGRFEREANERTTGKTGGEP
jgi:hypothetical protein